RSGGACIAYGPLSGTSTLASADCLSGDAVSDGFGQAAVGLGDLNGDGHADL
ncbi:MAG TPA: integrin-like protein, partial [Deltaproteobacteria bacterium]|nr:integrin-like protein [Deltaproteobacteria bacterium]